MVGSVRDLRNETAAREVLDGLNLNINVDLSEDARPPGCFSELVEHYRRKELAVNNERKSYSTKRRYSDYLTNWIVPRWGEYTLTRIENGIAVHVEEWLSTIQRSRGTRAKIRNIMSAVCSHAIRYGWMKTNPIRAVRQSAKRERIPVPRTAEELQALFVELGLRERTLVLLDVPTGMRRGELLALRWLDVDFQKRTLNIQKSIWQQHLGPVKTEESEKTMPLDEEMIADLLRWCAETPYAQDDEDVKTVQSPMRHANSNITMNIYTHAVSSKKRRAQSRVVEMILPQDRKAHVAVATGGTAYLLVYHAKWQSLLSYSREWRGRRDSNSRPLP